MRGSRGGVADGSLSNARVVPGVGAGALWAIGCRPHPQPCCIPATTERISARASGIVEAHLWGLVVGVTPFERCRPPLMIIRYAYDRKRRVPRSHPAGVTFRWQVTPEGNNGVPQPWRARYDGVGSGGAVRGALG